MGNNTSLYSVSRLSKRGNSASIDVKKIQYKNNDMMKWNVLYTIDGSKSELDLKCVLDTEGKVCEVLFDLTGDIWGEGGCLKFSVSKDESNFLKLTLLEMSYPRYTQTRFWGILRFLDEDMSVQTPFCLYQRERKITSAPGGGCATKSNTYVYGRGTKGGLLVTELKTKSGDKKPYMLTVAHYYAVYKEDNLLSELRRDVGISVIAKVQMSTKVGLDVIIEQGPMQHPSTGLFYMFSEVMKTGIWKPTSCPHCAFEASHDLSSESESDDHEKKIQPPRHHGNRGNVVNNNQCLFVGHFNGGQNNMKGGNFPINLFYNNNMGSTRPIDHLQQPLRDRANNTIYYTAHDNF